MQSRQKLRKGITLVSFFLFPATFFGGRYRRRKTNLSLGEIEAHLVPLADRFSKIGIS
jgi:hypothetical protein